ncbi:hypothetical protein [Phenylobacterium sp.]|jgi:hypothetical protein|uniref:hypothetical protein n=1 Tax=Phenylobacterium sp. TaxID=1871053 RepID=UPI002F95D91D
MESLRRPAAQAGTAEIIDFDEALLAACPPELRQDLMTEASMLADACSADDRPQELEAIARSLSDGARQAGMGRARARRLAAAIRSIARG